MKETLKVFSIASKSFVKKMFFHLFFLIRSTDFAEKERMLEF